MQGMPGALHWFWFVLHLQRLLCDDRDGVFPNEMLATSLNSVPLDFARPSIT